MSATLKKITAGTGYTYLTNSVARDDVDGPKNRQTLADYYTVHGESPGRWYGRGLEHLEVVDGITPTVALGGQVSEAHMRALFGEGLHPDADLIEKAMIARGIADHRVWDAVKLGRKFTAFDEKHALTPYEQALDEAYQQWRLDNDEAEIPPEVRAELRTAIGVQEFQNQFGFTPDERELHGFIVRSTRPKPQPCAGYDVTFEAPKSVSILWGLADLDTSAKIHQLHQQAVKECLDWFQDQLCFTRRGTDGVRQVRTNGAMIAMFDHRDSREGDPHLHTHCAISNKVQDAADGTWLALDGRDVHAGMVALSERYNTTIQALMSQTFGVTWTDVDHGPSKRPTREIDGVPQELIDRFSTRRRNIVIRQTQLAHAFQAKYHRPPTPAEAFALSQQAWEETRPSKTTGRSFMEQRAQWQAQAETAIGVENATTTAHLLAGRTPQPAPTQVPPTPGTLPEQAPKHALEAPAGTPRTDPVDAETADRQINQMANQVIETVSNSRARFNKLNLLAEAQRVVARAAIGDPGNPQSTPPTTAQIQAIVDQVTSLALATSVPLARPDVVETTHTPTQLLVGERSVYRRVNADLYSTQPLLDAEQRIIKAGAMRDGRMVPDVDLAVTLARQNAATAGGLNPAQRQLVTNLATSRRRLQVALAPAGSGKTTAMRALAQAWTESGGNVIGLSHQAVAAEQLREAVGDTAPCDTIMSLTFGLTAGHLPRWADTVGPATLIIVDEASMAATADLDQLTQWALQRGASIRLIGDERQLAAIGAGGVVRDLAATYGAVTLNELMRFRDANGNLDQAEAEASLGLRDGNHAALAHYADRGRIHAVSDMNATQMLFEDWRKDIEQGAASLMLVNQTDTVHDLNLMAQSWRRSLGQVDAEHTIHLGDRSTAGAGDTIVTRENNRKLRLSRTDYVRNRDRWTVLKVRQDGGIDVVNQVSRRRVTLPASYVAEHVELGYAATKASSQGVTVDRSRTLFDGTEDRASCYVPVTRGRFENHLYVTVSGQTGGDDAEFLDGQARLRSAIEVMEGVLDRQPEETLSATTTRRIATDPLTTLANDVAIYHDALAQYGRALLGETNIGNLAKAADRLAADRGYLRPLSAEPAWDALLTRLTAIYANGHDPLRALAATMDTRRLEDDKTDPSRDNAAVMCWRLEDVAPTTPGPLDWLPAVPTAVPAGPVPAGVDLAKWRTFLTGYSDQIAHSAAAIRSDAMAWRQSQVPLWARPFLTDQARGVLAQTAIWRAGHGVQDNITAPLGPETRAGGDPLQVRRYRQLNTQFTALAGASPWFRALFERRIADDPDWLVVAAKCTQAVRDKRISQEDLVSAIRLHSNPGSDDALPAENPAEALWYRLTRYLAPQPQVISAAAETPLRPDWAGVILDPAGTRADELVAHPDWRKLVDQVNRADNPEAIAGYAVRQTVDNHIPISDWVRYINAILPDLLRTYATPDSESPSTSVPADPRDEGVPVEPENTWDTSRPEDCDDAWYAAQLAERAAPRTRRAAPPDSATAAAPGAADDAGSRTQAVPPEASVQAGADTIPRNIEPPEPEESVPPDPETSPPADAGQPGTSLQRIYQLNEQAASYFESIYKHSWASPYLANRFGTDLADDPRWRVGYAPPNWHGLTQHMTRNGATVQELVDAGLAAYRRDQDGNLDPRKPRDVFEDRAMIAMRDPVGHIVGFAGRANPNAAPMRDGRPVPKYVNTATTEAFHKGELVFGADLAGAGATRVLVEGQFDAIAVTLAGEGHAVGLAPGGTALTDMQAELIGQLGTHIKYGGNDPLILVATDNDEAGQKAARRDYDILTAKGLAPRRLAINGTNSDGQPVKDPGEMLQYNRAALTMELAHPELAQTLVAQFIYELVGERTKQRQDALRPVIDQPDSINLDTSSHIEEAGRLIAQMPPEPGLYEEAAANAAGAFTGTTMTPEEIEHELARSAHAARKLETEPQLDDSDFTPWDEYSKRIDQAVDEHHQRAQAQTPRPAGPRIGL